MDGMNGMNGINGGIGNGLNGGMPVGFGMSLAMKEESMRGFASMTEAEKEEIILRARDAKSKKEMDKIVDSLANSDDEEVRKLRRESTEGE